MITQEINVNLIPGEVWQRVKVSQYDAESRVLNFNLYACESFDLSSVDSVSVEGLKPDGNYFAYNGTLSNGVVSLTIEQQMTAVAGDVECVIKLMADDAVLRTINFILEVEEKPTPSEEVVSETEIPSIIALATEQQEAAKASAEDSEAYAIGKRNGTAVTSGDVAYHNNAKYYASKASSSATSASNSASTATTQATLSKSYAVGGTSSRTGEDTDNAKYYSTQASSSASNASGYATSASGSANTATTQAKLAKSYAVGGTGTRTGENTDNAKYYKEEAETVAANLPKIYETTGESFGLTDTTESRVLATTVYGMSEQDGTPTPSNPVDIDSAVANFECVGKNLIPYPYYESTETDRGITYTNNDDGTVTVSAGTPQSGTNHVLVTLLSYYQPLKKDTQYILSSGYNGSGAYLRLQLYRSGSVVATFKTSNANGAVTFDTTGYTFNALQIQIFVTSTLSNDITFSPMLRLASVTDSTYEPYQSSSVNTDLTLRAIEVTSSDDYNLVRDGKYYIADTVDWSEDDGYTLTRRIGSSKASELTWTAFSNPNFAAVYTSGLNSVMQRLENSPSCYTKYFKGTIYNSSNPEDETIFKVNNLDIYSSTVITGSTTQEQTTAFNTWLGNNDFDIIYVLATPTTTSITPTQAEALLSLKTYDTATSITCTEDVSPTLTIEYAKSRLGALALTGHNQSEVNADNIAVIEGDIDTSTALTTTSQTVHGAINEINSNLTDNLLHVATWSGTVTPSDSSSGYYYAKVALSTLDGYDSDVYSNAMAFIVQSCQSSNAWSVPASVSGAYLIVTAPFSLAYSVVIKVFYVA